MLATNSTMGKQTADVDHGGGAAPSFDSSRMEMPDGPRRSTASNYGEQAANLGGNSSTVVDLVDTIISRIVPRLVLAHRGGRDSDPEPTIIRPPPSVAEIASLVDAICAQDAQRGLDQAELMLLDGLPYDSVLNDWMAAAARSLGEQWLEDDKTFVEVTIGMGTLHRILNMLRFRHRPLPAYRGMVLLSPAPGEQHILAIHLLADLLRRAGWEAVVKPKLIEEELVSIVSCEPTVLLGISANSSELLGPTRDMIRRVRKASLNRNLSVLLGGTPELMSQVDELDATYCSDISSVAPWLEDNAKISL